MDFASLEKDGWSDGEVAARYDASFTALTAEAAPVVLHAAGARRGARLLDVATGPGTLAGMAADVGALATGLDFSATMVSRARARYPAARFDEGDAQKLPYPDASFESLTCNFGLLHFPQPEAALLEAARVLARGGRGAWSVWEAQTPFFSLIPDSIRELGIDPRLPPAPDFFAFSQPGAFEAALARSGLRPEPVRRLAWAVRVPSVDAYWDSFGGGVRIRAAIEALRPEERSRVKERVAAKLATFARGVGFEVPVACVVGSARKSVGD